jgi:competence protein ComGF
MVPRGKLKRWTKQDDMSELILLDTQDLFFPIHLLKAELTEHPARTNS